jgi:WD40 repeat protein/serine/threonine protein kinase
MANLSGRTLGEFVLLEKIGQGGHGAVYRAAQPLLERNVVVKVLRKHDHVAQQRFLREAKLSSRLDHLFAAHIYAFGVNHDEDLLWIAMELVQGVTLSSWIEQHGPMSLEQFVPFFECIADAVQAAHACGIVHRDLKPSNVMVVECSNRLLPKLLDFGIAKTLDQTPGSPEDPPADDDSPRRGSSATVRLRPSVPAHHTQTDPNRGKKKRLTRTGAAFGSRPYMSPEQWSDAQAVGPGSDVYSLGVLAFEALTGRLPYAAENTQELYKLHRDAPLPKLGDGFPRDLDRVIGCAMAKLPEHRYRTPLEMAAEFREALQAQPRERLRSLARVWNDSARSPMLLLRGGDLLNTPAEVIGELERAFVAASHRRSVRVAWLRRCLAATAAALAVGVVWYRGSMETRAARKVAEVETSAARKVAEATVTQAELEQGRSALLHDEPDARRHLAEAYRRDHSPSTAFMLARALQPRLAEQARLPSTFERMWSAAFSPNDKQIVTTDDRNAQLWDAQSYRLLSTLKHGDVVPHAVYSTDGTKLATACGDGAVRIWDPATGALLHELRHEKLRPRYYVVALSPNGRLVVGLGLGTAHVWDIETGRAIAEFQDPIASSFPSAAFSADGHWLAMATGNDAYVFDTQAWGSARTTLSGSIHSLSWDPTGSRIATGSGDGDVAIWAIPSGKRLHHLRELGESIDTVGFSPNGQLVVAGSRDGAVQVWNATSAKLVSQSNHLRSKVLSVEFDRTSSLIAATSSGGSVAVSEMASGMPVTVLDGPTGVVRIAHFDSTSQRVVGASWDGTVRVWSAAALYRRWSSPSISDDCRIATSLEPDRRFLAFPCREQPTRVWDTASDRLVAELPSVTTVQGDFASAYPAISAAGDRAAVARGTNVEIYELPTARLLNVIKHSAAVDTVAFAASGRDVISGAVDGSVIVTRENGTVMALPSSAAGIDVVGFLADGRMVIADARRRLRVHDPSGVMLVDLETRDRVAIVRMSSDGHHLVTVPSFTDKVSGPELWDVEHYRRSGLLTSPGQGQVYSARFVSTEEVITGCGDGAIRLWDARTGELRQTYRGGSRFLVDGTLSADGTMLIGGGGDGQLRFWERSSGRPLWTMPAHRSHLIGVHVDGDSIVTRGFSGDIARWTLPTPGQVIQACDRNERCANVTR